MDIDANQVSTVNFKTSYSDYGYNYSYISIENDDFELDNNFFFNINIPESYKIAIIHNNSNESYFNNNKKINLICRFNWWKIKYN